MSYFYAHIIDPKDIHHELSLLDLHDDEREHLMLMIESTMHHVVVDALLTELPDEHKPTFLAHLAQDNHESLWALMHEHIEKPEDKILAAVQDLKEELLRDIRETLIQ